MYCDPSGLAKVPLPPCDEKVGGENGSTGIGKTGEGLSPDEVNPDVFKQIHADENGAYGYLPNAGTAYDTPEYDFTNVDWAQRQQGIRKIYLDGSDQLAIDISDMTAKGYTKQDIATYVVNERNQQKIRSRSMMLPEEIIPLEQRNIVKYGNPIGPTPEQAFESARNKLSGGGIIDVSVDDVWQKVIDNSMRKDDVINTLLGLKH